MGESPVDQLGAIVEPDETDVRVSRSAAVLEFQRAGFGIGGSRFLLRWLLDWTAVCVLLGFAAIYAQELVVFLFAIPFWVAWIVTAGSVVCGRFGSERMRIDLTGASVWRGFGSWQVYSKSAALHDVKEAVRHCSIIELDEDPVYGVGITTTGRPLVFGYNLEPEERKWIIALINRHLKELETEARDTASA